MQKIFTIGAIGPELQRPTQGVQRIGDRDLALPRLCRRVIGHVTVTAKISCIAKTGCASQHILTVVRTYVLADKDACSVCLLAAGDVQSHD